MDPLCSMSSASDKKDGKDAKVDIAPRVQPATAPANAMEIDSNSSFSTFHSASASSSSPSPSSSSSPPAWKEEKRFGIPKFQLDWMQSAKTSWTRQNAVNKQLRIDPPNATSAGVASKALSLCLKPLIMWAPAKLWADLVQFVPCPEPDCKAKTEQHGYAKEPRLVQCIEDSYYLWSSVHVCKDSNHKSFLASNPLTLEKLPAFVRSHASFFLTERAAVTSRSAEFTFIHFKLLLLLLQPC